MASKQQCSPLNRLRCIGIIFLAAIVSCNRNETSDKARPEVPPGDSQPQITPTLRIGSCSKLGNFREGNDDAVAVSELDGAMLCIAADGMGAEDSGRNATKIAIAVLTRELKASLPQASTFVQNQKAIGNAIVAANLAIMQEAGKSELAGIGTTVAVALWRPGHGMFIAGIGNSRIYLVRGNEIRQLTIDHNLAQALFEAGKINEQELAEHRFRNVLWKYLGSKEVGEQPEVSSPPVQAGDRFFLCTDGLHGVVSNDQILFCMKQHADVQKCADALCQLALDSGSRDNVSCIVVAISETN